jgi:transcriptional regulator with XRE-family HTH domain
MAHSTAGLREIITYVGLTQDAIKQALGVSQTLVSFWLTGERIIGQPHLGKLLECVQEAYKRHRAELGKDEAKVYRDGYITVIKAWMNELAQSLAYEGFALTLLDLVTLVGYPQTEEAIVALFRERGQAIEAQVVELLQYARAINRRPQVSALQPILEAVGQEDSGADD